MAGSSLDGTVATGQAGTASTLVVKAWARYGHDRLYVQDDKGVRIGYWDNRAGQAVVDDESRRAEFDSALAAYWEAGGHTRSEAGRAPDAHPDADACSPHKSETVPSSHPAAAPAGPPPAAGPVVSGSVVLDPAGPSGGAAQSGWDLAGNHPGEAARRQATAYRQAAPVKTVLARVLGVHTDERAWRIGADGEEAVAARLLRLGAGWKLLHAVPVGEHGSDIDHVVIGPGGVYTINAKHHPDANVWVAGDTFLVNGQKHPYVRNSRFEARRASKLLGRAVGFPVAVIGVVVVFGAQRGFTVKSQPPAGDVYVVGRRQIDGWLAGRTPLLDAGRIDAIYAQARRSTTWTTE